MRQAGPTVAHGNSKPRNCHITRPILTAAENKPIECYAISINSAGTKMALGGLDGQVKVWDIEQILRTQNAPEAGELETLTRRMDDPLERPLASMSRHNGVVTSVKFLPDGRFLASGSDDKIVLIWEKDDDGVRPKQFGDADADLEHWTVRKRLVAHDNDVQDICWLPDGLLLLTVGLDRSIIIWNGATFERIKRYDIHQSMVKGVVFDPANKFFATASDDRTVRVFRYYRKLNDTLASGYEFQMEQVVVDAFRKSPLTSYFRRMSWSPDGQHIAVPNAMNGPVSAVAIINRGNWACDVSLIGHEAPLEVCLFAPRLFSVGDTQSAVLASAGQDRTLAVWSTALTKPLVVAHDIAQKSVTDAAWTPDARALFLSSLDGLISVVLFEENELGVPCSDAAVSSQLVRYGGDRDSATMAEGIEQLRLEALAPDLKRANQREGKAAVLDTLAGVEAPSGSFSVLNHSFGTGASGASSTAGDVVESTALQKHDGGFGTQHQPGTENALVSGISAHQSLAARLSNGSDSPGFLDSSTERLPEPKTPQQPKAPALSSTPLELSALPKQKLSKVVIKNGRKRVAPTLVSGGTSVVSQQISKPKLFHTTKVSTPSYTLSRLGVQTAVHGLRLRTVNQETNGEDNDNEDMGYDDTTQATGGFRQRLKKYRRSVMAAKYPTPLKMVSDLPEVLFANQAVMQRSLARLVQPRDLVSLDLELINTAALESLDETLYFRVFARAVKHLKQEASFTEAKPEDAAANSPNPADLANGEPRQVTSIVEVRNGPAWPDADESVRIDFEQRTDFQDPTQVIVTTDDQSSEKSYVLYFPYRIQRVVPLFAGAQLAMYALISFDGTTQLIHAETGTFVTPAVELGGNVVAYRHRGPFFLMLTSMGDLFCWRLRAFGVEKVVSGVSIASVLNMAPCTDLEQNSVVDLDVDEATGAPSVIIDPSNCAFTYSCDLQVWVKTVDPWYFLAGDAEELPKRRAVALTHGWLQQRVQKGEAVSYNFTAESAELKSVMERRLREMVSF